IDVVRVRDERVSPIAHEVNGWIRIVRWELVGLDKVRSWRRCQLLQRAFAVHMADQLADVSTLLEDRVVVHRPSIDAEQPVEQDSEERVPRPWIRSDPDDHGSVSWVVKP